MGSEACVPCLPQSCLQRAGPHHDWHLPAPFWRDLQRSPGWSVAEWGGGAVLGLFNSTDQDTAWGCLPNVEGQEGTRRSGLLGAGPLTSGQGDHRPKWQQLCVWQTHSGSFKGHRGLFRGRSGVCAMGAAPRRVLGGAQHSSLDTMPWARGKQLQGEPRADLGSVPDLVGPLPSCVPLRHCKCSPSPALMPATAFLGIPTTEGGRHCGDHPARTLSRGSSYRQNNTDRV